MSKAGGTRPIVWRDVTTRLGAVLWPKSISRSFWEQDQLVRFLARTFPRSRPAVPRFDFRRRRLILAAAGPRSSTGYSVEVVRIFGRRDGVHVLVHETAPTLGRRVTPRLTSPYRLITIPATTKRVYVEWQGRP